MKVDIKHLESLSKLNIVDSQEDKFEQDLVKILNFVNEITELDLPEEKKTMGVSLSSLREDEVTEQEQCDVLANAPSKKDGCYLTPLVVE
ncbi:MAG: Asp-tRNA(Asn)/Glu-tRNA(Gln) amidotransferase subunit GatC [Clostridia bacterium]|nr:Asp-tRNA(Asn)/Glu-tRNA(Gln) amidotransferase subunit GatC [Clostridia bacterium]